MGYGVITYYWDGIVVLRGDISVMTALYIGRGFGSGMDIGVFGYMMRYLRVQG